MIYFKAQLPKELGYSPGHIGDCYMPKNPKVLFYNEQSGIVVASCDTKPEELDPNLTPIAEDEVMGLLEEARGIEDQAGIFEGDTLHDKWLPEAVGIERVPVELEKAEEGEGEPAPVMEVVDSRAIFCNICHKMLGYQVDYANGTHSLKIGGSTIQGIPAGQKINAPCVGHTAKITVRGVKGEAKIEVEPEPEAPISKFCPVCFDLIVLRARDTIESPLEDYIPETIIENYETSKYKVCTCTNGHRIKELIDGK